MMKVLNFLILYISLFIVETICYFFIFLIYFIFDKFSIKYSFELAIVWNSLRYIYFGIPFIILFFLLFKYVGKINLYKPFLFSLFNVLIYILLSFFISIIIVDINGLNPSKLFFWLTCIPIILSPLILWQVPYYKKIMTDL